MAHVYLWLFGVLCHPDSLSHSPDSHCYQTFSLFLHLSLCLYSRSFHWLLSVVVTDKHFQIAVTVVVAVDCCRLWFGFQSVFESCTPFLLWFGFWFLFWLSQGVLHRVLRVSIYVITSLRKQKTEVGILLLNANSKFHVRASFLQFLNVSFLQILSYSHTYLALVKHVHKYLTHVKFQKGSKGSMLVSAM
jgi:hypothetical protein